MSNEHITTRQQQILKAIIDEYVDTAQPVGSENLVEKYQFDFSPATTRNEMAELTRLGYLQKDHSSAGRTPTPHAFRYYVKNMMQEKEIPVVNEVAIKQRLWQHRHDQEQLLRQASLSLAEELQNLTVITTDNGQVYASGAAHILRHPEFYDIDLTRAVLHLLDQYDLINYMLSQLSPEAEYGLLLGEETGIPSMAQCGMVTTRIDLPRGRMGYISVLGPYRLDYSSVIPTMRYLQRLVNEMSRSW